MVVTRCECGRWFDTISTWCMIFVFFGTWCVSPYDTWDTKKDEKSLIGLESREFYLRVYEGARERSPKKISLFKRYHCSLFFTQRNSLGGEGHTKKSETSSLKMFSRDLMSSHELLFRFRWWTPTLHGIIKSNPSLLSSFTEMSGRDFVVITESWLIFCNFRSFKERSVVFFYRFNRGVLRCHIAYNQNGCCSWESKSCEPFHTGGQRVRFFCFIKSSS